MKKLLFTLVLMLSLGLMADAQFRFGLKAAANFASTNGDGDETKVGFSGGILGQFMINDRWAIQPEVLFNMQGAKWDGGKINLNYVGVPIMVQFYVIEGLSVELGPQVSVLVTAKSKQDGRDDRDWKDSMEKVEAALGFGAAYELKAAPVGFFMRGTFGLTRVAKKDTSFDEDLRNRAFQLGVFVKF